MIRRWTDEILTWLKTQCPLHDHGYANMTELVNALNAKFGTKFNARTLSKGLSRAKIATGLHQRCHGHTHWAYHSVGTIKTMDGEPWIKLDGGWVQLRRHVYHNAHPQEDLTDKCIVVLDGNADNVDCDNLVALSRQEHLQVNRVLASVDNPSKEDREIAILQAKIRLAKMHLIRQSPVLMSKYRRSAAHRHRLKLHNQHIGRDVAMTDKV